MEGHLEHHCSAAAAEGLKWKNFTFNNSYSYETWYFSSANQEFTPWQGIGTLVNKGKNPPATYYFKTNSSIGIIFIFWKNKKWNQILDWHKKNQSTL